MVFNTFPFEPPKYEIILVYREVPGFFEITDRPSPSPLSLPGALFHRRPPYAARAPAAKWTRGNLSTPPGPPLGTSSRAHESQTPPRAATTPRPAQRRCLLRPLAVESPRAKSTAPRRHIPHPGAPWPIKTPRTPPSRPFSSFFFLPPLRHGRRDPALADRLAQPHIAPSDHRNSFATS